jgi:hypothetical protein
MILMAPCIIDFIGANALLGPVGGGGPRPWTGHSWALKWHRAKRVPFGPRSVKSSGNLSSLEIFAWEKYIFISKFKCHPNVDILGGINMKIFLFHL